MATKPNASAVKKTECVGSAARAQEHPWLKAYPKAVSWDLRITPTLVGELLDQSVAAYGARPCTYFMGKRLSYAEIGALSDRAAKGLRELGVGEGVKVGLFMPNTPAFVIFYYGVLKAGGTVVNFNPLYSLEEIEFQIRDSGAKIMVTLDLELTYGKIAALLQRGALDTAVVASFTSLLPALKSVGFKLTQRTKLAAVGGTGARGKLVRARELLANDGRYERPSITPEAIAVLQYTGGTTGTPKGAMLSHANLSVNVGQVKAWQNSIIKDGDRILGVLPLFHVFAMTTVMNFGISHGLEIILLPKFELIPTLKLIAKLRPTMMPGVPTLFNAMLRHPHIANFDLSSLKYCIAGGAALPIEIKRGFEAISGATLVEGYGLSETSPVVACNPPQSSEGRIDRPSPARHRDLDPLARGPHACPQARRGRRDLHRRPPSDDRLLEQAARHRGLLRGSLLPHRGCRLHGRAGLCLHRRSHQGHDQRLGLQGLSAADRGCAL